MLDSAKGTLGRLRKLFAAGSEMAYSDRDAAEGASRDEAYAEGEGHAYGIAEGEVRKAEKAIEPPEND